MIHRETITPKMHEIARLIQSRLDSAYYLAGGTAIALLVGHRESIDLDYFIAEHIDTEKLKKLLRELFPEVVFTSEDVDTLWCMTNGVKVSFISRFAPLLEVPTEAEGFRIASLRDLVVMKLSAVCGRDEYKDYYDLAELSTVTDAREWPAWWGQAYPESDPVAWIVALSHVGSVATVPLRGTSLESGPEVIEKLQNLVKELSPFV